MRRRNRAPRAALLPKMADPERKSLPVNGLGAARRIPGDGTAHRTEDVMSERYRAVIGVLLDPRTQRVVDIFRALGDFEAAYDIAVIDVLEHRLTGICGPSGARAIVSDALLFGFALRNKRTDLSWPHGDWDLAPIGTRQATAHECAMLALVAGCGRMEDDFQRDEGLALATLAATRLGVRLDASLASLARELATRIARAGMPIDRPDWPRLLDNPIETVGARRPVASASQLLRF